jgi:hypothetical protein
MKPIGDEWRGSTKTNNQNTWPIPKYAASAHNEYQNIHLNYNSPSFVPQRRTHPTLHVAPSK